MRNFNKGGSLFGLLNKVTIFMVALLFFVGNPHLSKAESIADLVQISGKVTDAEGMGLPGVTVMIVGTTNGTSTDSEGNYSLEANQGDVISFSYIGMKTQQITVGASNVINVTLEEDANALDEVVIVGYGTQKKSDVSSAITTISTEEMGTITLSSIGTALQGRAAGLNIRDAGYNQGLSVLVRGATTIGNNSPLFIVDGVQQSALNIDPNDIETITVLKDGAASAIYGSRASAGVILVTTKTGGNNKVSFNYEVFNSWSNLTTTPDNISSIESAEIMNEASLNSGGALLFTQADFDKFNSGTDPAYPNTDWLDVLLKTEKTQRHYLSARGGNENTNYFVAVSYRTADGIFDTGIERNSYSFRSNLNTKLRSNLDLSLNVSYLMSDNTSPSVNGGMDNIYLHASSTAPFLPVYNANGDYEFFNGAGGYGRGFWNARWELDAGTSNSKGKTFTMNTALNWKPVEGLTVTSRLSTIQSNSDFFSNTYSRSYSGGPVWFSEINNMYRSFSNGNQFNSQLYANYEKNFGAHTIGALAGWDVQFNKGSFLSAGRRDFQFNDMLTELNAPNSGDPEDLFSVGSNTSESALQSGFGRINYNFDEKYFVEVAARYDGSSVFAPETRYGFFPAASAGWMISKEDFFSVTDVDFLKLRTSYGLAGNNSVSGSYFSNISFGNYYFGDGSNVAVTAAEGGIPFRGLRWETTTSFNLGVDASYRNGFITGSLDFYNKITDDILLPSPVPGTVGTYRAGPAINAGSVKNSGVEIVLGHNNSFSNGLTYGVNFNMSINNNEILELTDAFSEFSSSYRVGDPLGTIYGYKSGGILRSAEEVAAYQASIDNANPNLQPGDLAYVDANGDGTLNFKDVVSLGATIPKFTYGVTLNASWKGFDAQLFLQGIAKTEQYKSTDLFGNYEWIPPEAKDAYSADNTDGEYPRLLLFAQQTYFHNFYTTSSYWTFNGAYMRLKNLQLGYTVPLPNQKYVSGVRVYFTGDNVFTMSDFRPGYDPESNGLTIPPLRSFTLGLNIKF